MPQYSRYPAATTDVQHMSQHIPGCVTKIFEGEGHGSYIVHSEKIAQYILEVC